jgi:hypothetical protein
MLVAGVEKIQAIATTFFQILEFRKSVTTGGGRKGENILGMKNFDL